jgi:hypothetical protein
MEERRKGEEEWGVLGWLGRISNEILKFSKIGLMVVESSSEVVRRFKQTYCQVFGIFEIVGLGFWRSS